MTTVPAGCPLNVRQWMFVKDQKLLAIRPTFSSSEGRYLASANVASTILFPRWPAKTNFKRNAYAEPVAWNLVDFLMLLFLRRIRAFRPTAYTSFDPLTLDGSFVAYISVYSTVSRDLWHTSRSIKRKLRFFLKGSPRPSKLRITYVILYFIALFYQ